MWRTPASSDGDARVACRGCKVSATYIVALFLQRMDATPVCECLPWTLPSVWTNVHGKHRIQVLHPLLESYDVASRLQVSFPSNSEVVCVQYVFMQRPTLASSPADKMLLADILSVVSHKHLISSIGYSRFGLSGDICT